MAVRDICRMGNPVLRKENKKLSKKEIHSKEFKDLIQDMIDTMNALGGIGIAAPQIGVNLQVAILLFDPNQDNQENQENEDHQGYSDEFEDYPEDLDQAKKDLKKSGISTDEILVIINPQISVIDSQLQGFWEGCLSVPGLRGFVERPKKIVINYLDQNAKEQKLEASGFLATVFQHEIDHLFATLYVDRITDTKLLSFDEEYLKFKLDQ